MSPDGAYRLEDILALLPEEALRQLAEALECRDTISAVRDRVLHDGALAATLDRLDGDALAALQQVAGVVPPVLASDEALSPELASVVEAGLAYVVDIQEERRLLVPLEIQMELHRRQPLGDPDLRILLLALDEEALSRLETTYLDEDGEEEPPPDRLGRVSRLADAMESPATLREIHENLPATAREVLGWTCEHGGPLGSEEVRELARDAAEFYTERPGVAVEQLHRFGLLLAHDLDDSGEVFVVPRSLRRAILSLIDQDLVEKTRAAYEALTASGTLSFPDEGPHGWGGDALRAFRLLALGWVADRVHQLPSEFGVAVGMQILDAGQHRPGAFASLLLDLSGETAFSRQALRLWLALIDDPWTVDLVNAMRGDAQSLVTYFTNGEAEGAEDDAEIWFGHLFLIRAQLVLMLSLLAPGKWFSIRSLSHLFHLILARSTINNLSHESLSGDFPYEALPDYGVVLARQDRLERVAEWLHTWLVEFAAVIGAAEVDGSGTCLRVHPDAFCVFRDSDLWFRTVWDDLSPIVGEDLDIWMPIPNDPGPRVCGVAATWLDGPARILIERHCHLADLLRLAQWGTPTGEPDGYGFDLTEDTVARALEQGLDGEEMLIWLTARLDEALTPALRGLFPHSSSAVDGADERWRELAADRVEELLLSLESWGGSPPGRLLEEIRSWGPVAVARLEARLQRLAERGKLDDPMTQHLCLLLGELGALSASDTLLAVLLQATSDVPQHAAAAALMRLGEPVIEELLQLLRAQETARETRLLLAMTLSGLATLYPHSHERVADALVQVIHAHAFDRDLQTRLALELCRMGNPRAEAVVDELQGEESWSSDEWRPEDALWLVRVSPCVWGSLLFSTPLAMLYLVSDEADELAREAGVRDLLSSVGLSSERVLYGRPRPRKE